ncbi:MAG: MBL fold metallo-hydrolase [Cohnella sp.]|nr:MBL fold metallo-hydrolase [Cohnella sp.]
MLSISAPVMGRVDTVHPVLLWDDRDMVLVDTGFPGQLEQLRDQIASHGLDPARLNRIVITHQDIDHIGNLPELVALYPVSRVEVSAHPIEKPYIEGEKRLLRFTDEAIASIDRLPDTVPEPFKQGLKALMLNPPRAAVDRKIRGGERLPWCGGLAVIDTPGHTPGHISLYHEPSRTLIAGDSLVVREGQLHEADPATTLDRTTARASVARLSAYDIKAVICYHGGIFRLDAKRRLIELSS